MRKLEWVGRTEMVLGAFVLLLIAGVVTAFVLQAFSNTDYLFTLGEEAYQTPAIPREQLVAERMLPALDDARWRVSGPARALPASEAGGISTDLAAFGVELAYRRRYATTQEPRRDLTVLACDAATAAQAFGLCRARRPADHESLDSGRDGWLAADGLQAGFWNGRYYTELRLTPARDGEETVMARAAAAVAEGQLAYGEPFRAEKMLPSSNRKPDSFRYVHRAAFGNASLDKVFLVDLTNDVTAWVREAQSAAGAKRVYERLGAGGTPGVERQGALTIVRESGGVLAFFLMDRYVQGVFGSDRDAVVASAIRAHEAALRQAGAAGETARPAAAWEDNPFPDPDLEGWRAPRRAERFGADNLYVKIDGRAEAYLQYQVVKLIFGTYYHSREADRTLDAYWYDMGKPANAYGIYRAEAAPAATPVDLGREAYQVGGAVFFCKGSSYVQVLPARPDGTDSRAARKIARRIADEIDEATEVVWADDVLPRTMRVEDSFAYIARDAFGLGFLADVYTADYNFEGARITLFVHRAQGEDAATTLLEKYEAFLGEFGRVTWRDPDPSRRVLAGDVSGLIDVVFVRGRYLAGVAGAENARIAKKAALEFYERMTSD